MTVTTIYQDMLTAICDVIHNRFIQIELITLLIEIGNLQPGATANLTMIGLQLPEQHLDEGGLAGTIRADNAYPVTAHDGRREVFDNDVLAKSQIDMLRLEHQLAGLLALVELQFGFATPVTPHPVLFTQCLQRPHPALIARSPCLYPLANPDFFLRQFFIEQRVMALLYFQLLGFTAHVVIITTRP